MVPFYFSLVWIGSVFVATVLGYERGRWAMGLGLGLGFGPLGALAAGMLAATPEIEAQRAYLLEKHLEQWRKQDAAERKERRREAAALTDFVRVLQEQIEQAQPETTFAENLTDLARELEHLAHGDPAKERALRSWITWLRQHSALVRAQMQQTDGGL